MWEIKIVELIAGKHKTEKQTNRVYNSLQEHPTDLKLCPYDPFLKVSTIPNQHQARKQDSIT